MNPLPQARNPRRLLTRQKRRVLFHLSRGGRLVFVRCQVPKQAVRRPDLQHPERYYFMLHPNPEVSGYCVTRSPRVRMVRKNFLLEIVAAGYLKPRELWEDRREAKGCDLAPLGREILAATDWDGLPKGLRPAGLSIKEYLARKWARK